MTASPKPIEDLVEPSEFRAAFETMMAQLQAMTAKELLDYRIKSGRYNSDGTPKWPEGEPSGMACP